MILDTLLEYDSWANQAMITGLAAASTPRAMALIAHIIAAQDRWVSRIRGEEPRLAVWPELDVDECAALAAELPGRWRSILEEFAGGKLDTKILYINIAGESFESTVEQIILHIAIHGGYHRGQSLYSAMPGVLRGAEYMRRARHR